MGNPIPVTGRGAGWEPPLAAPAHAVTGQGLGLLTDCFVWPGIMIYKLEESRGAKRR